MHIGDRIKLIRLDEGLSQAQLGDRIGVTKQQISRIESGKSNASTGLLKLFCREFGVSEKWLINEEGERYLDIYEEDRESSKNVVMASFLKLEEMLKTKSNVRFAHYIYSLNCFVQSISKRNLSDDSYNDYLDLIELFYADFDRFLEVTSRINTKDMPVSELLNIFENHFSGLRKTLVSIFDLHISNQTPSGVICLSDHQNPITMPVVGRAAAGIPIEMIREYDDTIDIAGPIKPGDFAVIAVGDSMTGDDIHDGDRVVIRKQDVVEDGELALVAVDGGSTIKRVYFNGTTIRLEASNPAYNPQIYDFMHEVRILGKVIQVIKSAKS